MASREQRAEAIRRASVLVRGCVWLRRADSSSKVKAIDDDRAELQRLRNAIGDVRGMQSDGATAVEMDRALGKILEGGDES